jgi:hypothetical protein
MELNYVVQVLNEKFTSGNSIPVERTTITKGQWDVIMAELSLRAGRQGGKAYMDPRAKIIVEGMVELINAVFEQAQPPQDKPVVLPCPECHDVKNNAMWNVYWTWCPWCGRKVLETDKPEKG